MNYENNNIIRTKTMMSSTSFSSNHDREQIIRIQNELHELKNEYTKKEAIIKELYEQRTNLEAENENLKNELQNLNNKEEGIINENNNIKQQLINCHNKNKEYEKIINLKEQEISTYKDKLNEFINYKNNLENEINHLKTEIENYRIQINQVQQNPRIVRGEIIKDNRELEFLAKTICKDNRKITLNLLYKATIDGDKAKTFHQRCDSAKSTVVLVKSDKDKRFGGFTNCSWESEGASIEKEDKDAFVFSLDKMKKYDVIPYEKAIACYPNYGPIFLGCQLRIYDNAFEKGGSTYFKGANYYTEEDFELSGGEKTFKVKEIEVYGVIME